VLVLLSDIQLNGLDIVHAGDASADEPWLFGVKEPFWREFLANPAVICAAHVSFLGCSILRLRPPIVTPQN
jgi:hypothetical protein